MVNRILAFSELFLKSINLVVISHALVKSTNINTASVQLGLTYQVLLWADTFVVWF